jgi:cell wall-associated NlpC family hydrolase
MLDIPELVIEAPVPTTEKKLSEEFITKALERIGSKNYVWSGTDPNVDGGTDCSGTIEWSINQVIGKKIPRLNANGQAIDSRITLPGDNSRGSLNFYDWNRSLSDFLCK